MQPAGNPVNNHGQALITALHQGCHIATIPAQGGGAVGFVTPKLGQGQQLAIRQMLQQQTGAPLALPDRGQELAIATEGRLLAIANTADLHGGGPVPAPPAR